RRDDLEPEILAMLHEAEHLTAENRALNLVIAFNYGARDEMVRAIRAIAAQAAAGAIRPAEISSKTVSAWLDTRDIPDPELIIRTSGEQRLSNFLLWQAAYSEFLFVPCYWPDFSREHLFKAIAD